MTRFVALPALVAILALSAGPARADPSHSYDWRALRSGLDALSVAFEPAAAQAGWAGRSEGYAFDMRRICTDETETFVATVVGERCPDGACAGRRAELAAKARGLATQIEPRMVQSANDGLDDIFVPAGLTLISEGAQGVPQLGLRSAHDIWMRAWMDPLMASTTADDRDQGLILARVWCGLTRSNAAAAAEYLAESGFPDTDAGDGRLLPPVLVNIAIHAAWEPSLVRPIRDHSDRAFENGRLHGYYAASLIDIDAMASSGTQRIGTLFSCEDGAAYPDPPLADATSADVLRARYGLPPLADAVTSRSRRCAAEG